MTTGTVQRLLDLLDLSQCNGCDGCGLRCTAGVPMTRREFDEVRGYLDRHGFASGEFLRGASVDLGDGIAIEACPFRDTIEGRCRIYPVRPFVCRLMGLVEWMPCPIGRVTTPAPTAIALEAVQEYCKAARKPYHEWLEEV